MTLKNEGFEISSAENFIDHKQKFDLGFLTTEGFHPKTSELSKLCHEDSLSAVRLLREVEVDAVRELLKLSSRLEKLYLEIGRTLGSGGRVFISGCGATGRLALTLEFLFRSQENRQENSDQVVSFMAGGDLALIKSIESFEDYAEYGRRQLLELGFGADDLLIGVTEGGETSFVLGTIEAAAEISSRPAFFAFCNPIEQLRKIERSQQTLDLDGVEAIELPVGPMALSGSTRMQASTVLLLAIGSCLFNYAESFDNVEKDMRKFSDLISSARFDFLSEFVDEESRIYQEGGRVTYSTNDYGMTIVTDTTERSPTFSLAPFEYFEDETLSSNLESLCYFHIQGTNSSDEAWKKLLGRPPRALNWENVASKAGPQRLKGYDFSSRVLQKRSDDHIFSILKESDCGGEPGILWSLNSKKHFLRIGDTSTFHQHLLLKSQLNALSTAIMGRLGRFEGNCMTWVKPSNGKLIDRAVRYVMQLSKKKLDYDAVVKVLFKEIEGLQPGEPIVTKVLNAIEDGEKNG